LRAAEKAFQDLAEMPGMGPLKVHEGRFAGARMWRVPGFESVLIVYRPKETVWLSSVLFTLNRTINAFLSDGGPVCLVATTVHLDILLFTSVRNIAPGAWSLRSGLILRSRR